MKCPACTRRATKTRLADGSAVFYCEACGWGKERVERAASGEAERRGASFSFARLALMTTLSLAIVFGPYLALVYGGGAVNRRFAIQPDFEATVERTTDLLNPAYWIVMACYLMLASMISPSWDPKNLFPLPYYWRDDWNRFNLYAAILLAPGKIVCATLAGWWGAARSFIEGRA
jgi:hypothetical protein